MIASMFQVRCKIKKSKYEKKLHHIIKNLSLGNFQGPLDDASLDA